MEIFRYIFLISIITGCVSIGYLLSGIYYERAKELNILSNLINILQNKIRFTHKPLGDILEEISEIKGNARISEMFLKVSEKIKDKKIEDAWNEAITEQKFFLNLKKEDINLLKTLGNVLGKTDIDGQISEINQFSALLKMQAQNAEEEKSKNAKMYRSLGTIIGLAIVIILY